MDIHSHAARRFGALLFLIIGISPIGLLPAYAQSTLVLTDHATGETATFAAPGAAFRMTGDGSAVSVEVATQSPGRSTKIASAWNLRFEAPEGSRLQEGSYAQAGCTGAMRSGRAPGMQVSNNNPVCRPGQPGQDVWGAFAVRQARYDAGGQLVSLEILFSQRVGSASGDLLTGLLRVDAAPLSLDLASDPGFPWGDLDAGYHGDDSLLALEGDAMGMVFTASVPRNRVVVLISPPVGQLFATGTYRTRPSASLARAGLLVRDAVDGHACTTIATGELSIRDASYAEDGRVTGLHATFAYRCREHGPALRGTIHYEL